MRNHAIIAGALAWLCCVHAAPSKTIEKRAISLLVSGTPPGFASGTTGGGTATPVYPSTIAQLKTYLTSSSPQVIVISGTFNFQGSEGSTTYAACNPYSCTPAAGGQALLNTLNGCTTTTYNVQIDTAAYQGIQVASDKTLIGNNNAVLYGKGLRLVGVSNIIIQNIAITNLNPAYVWGGDAVVLSDTSNVWIDHVTTSYLGRQHYSFGQKANRGITISNSYISGFTSNSATCDGHSYWALELVGVSDQITFYRNHVYQTSGRSPALSGGTLFHAVNNVWNSNSGHLIEGTTTTAYGVYEGNVFLDSPTIVSSFPGHMFSSESAYLLTCSSYIGRTCIVNTFTSSGTFAYHDTAALTALKGSGYTIVAAASASSIQSSVISGAGNML